MDTASLFTYASTLIIMLFILPKYVSFAVIVNTDATINWKKCEFVFKLSHNWEKKTLQKKVLLKCIMICAAVR